MIKGSRGSYLSEIGVVEVVKLAGNYWRTTGYSMNARCFLYPEEALYLFEEKKIHMEGKGEVLSLESFYTTVTTIIPLQCYLTYAKLKVRPSSIAIHLYTIQYIPSSSLISSHLLP
jgi:tRNA-splicing endonuclease subunit sen54 N-term